MKGKSQVSCASAADSSALSPHQNPQLRQEFPDVHQELAHLREEFPHLRVNLKTIIRWCWWWVRDGGECERDAVVVFVIGCAGGW
eukprot:517296-Rhodomonas_salina.1